MDNLFILYYIIMINNINNFFNDFAKFAVENNVFSFFMGTVIGFASGNVIRSFKNNIVDFYILKLFNLPESNIITFLTTLIEYFLIIYALFILYNVVFKPVIDKQRELQRQAVARQEETIKWEQQLLTTLDNINNKLTSGTT